MRAILAQFGGVLTIGNFDGVHVGHQNLLAILKNRAQQLQLPLLIIIFEPQPSEFFLKTDAPARLYTLREKIQDLKTCGVDYIYCLRFNQKLSNMPADEFANKIIFSQLNVKELLIGEDFRFGKQRSGDSALLKSIAHKHQACVLTCESFLYNNHRISSTRIRQALANNQFADAQAMLNRPYALSGKVIYGRALARQLNAPTANIVVKQKKVILQGVFCVKIIRENNTIYNGVANLGFRPTVDGKKLMLEVHLFALNCKLYGERLKVIFLHKLRDEQSFANLDALKIQIHQDLQHAQEYFKKVQHV